MGRQPNPEQLQNSIRDWLKNVQQHLQWQRDSFRALNEAIPREAREAIEKRRSQLLANQNLVAGLGIPLKRRLDTPMTYAAPKVKRKLAPRLPPATAGIFKPEPMLEEAEYQHILGVVESMAHVLERSPKAFYYLDEESLRTHF